MLMHTDALVIGAGVVGLAVARSLAIAGREVIVLEAEDAIGTGISSRNSEVIHAGIYYAAGSLKARLCTSGRDLMYRYAQRTGVPVDRCGKLIVATATPEHGALEAIRRAAAANGVALEWLDAAAARALEPEISCTAALRSPLTGIVDSHALMTQLHADLEAAGGTVVFRTPVVSGRTGRGGVVLVTGGNSPAEIASPVVVNAAGLSATAVACALGVDTAHVPDMALARGNYFSCTARPRFSHLVYPLPEPGGLGVHVTRDLGGAVRFGPDVEWIERIDYRVDPARSSAFYAAIRRYWPALPDDSLVPDYAGIRPKLGRGGGDFRIDDDRVHGVAGLINLFGIESPGLTASLAIADHVAQMAGPRV